MKKIIIKDGQPAYEDTNILDYALGTVVNPITLKPSTGGQTLIFGGICVVTGLAIGATVGKKAGQKIASAFTSEKEMAKYA